MQAGVGLLVADVMPIYMIIPRYSHNYAQFCQLLNSNSFTHRKILMLSREATSERYDPWVYLHHINLPTLSYLLCFYFTLHLYHKNTKNIILSYLSDLTLVSDRVGIANPLSRWLRRFICFVQVRGTRAQPPTGLLPWFSKTEGNTYATLLHHPFLFKGKPTQCSRVSTVPQICCTIIINFASFGINIMNMCITTIKIQ